MTAHTTLESLLVDWINKSLTVISEFSGDSYGDWAQLIEDAKVTAEALNIPWSDEFFPSYVRDLLAYNKEDE